MSGINLKIEDAKGLFFDRQAITGDADRKAKRIGSAWGGYVRRTARNSIKKATKKRTVSRPGQPPVGHGDQLLKRFIFYGWDPSTESTVVGPVKLNKPGTAPSTLEGGGKLTISRGGLRGARRQTVTIKPRPYMEPAADAGNHALPRIIAEASRKG